MSSQQLTQSIKQKALDVGFDLVGITSTKPHDDIRFFEEWLNKGSAGTMAYLARNKDKRGDPQRVLDGAKTFICLGLSYNRGHARSVDSKKEGHGWISNYAWGDDYHEILLEKLKLLEEFIHIQVPEAKMKSYVDTGPILERSYSASAGLGWIGKNTCLLNKEIGSFFLSAKYLPTLN